MFIVAALLLNLHSAFVDVSIQQHREEILTAIEQFDSIDSPLIRKNTHSQTTENVSNQVD